ncbi:MAG: hypothetical protein M3Y21_10165 [Candidatus Eremiobacteraeota bacterium]|nr:hypothetical protein [Candidatus Eremiobacteraeota bacterium]
MKQERLIREARTNGIRDVDLAVLTTVNAPMSSPASADELTAWLSGDAEVSFGRADLCVFAFFTEVPLENQVAFLSFHRIDLTRANEIAARFVRPQIAGGSIPLDRVL